MFKILGSECSIIDNNQEYKSKCANNSLWFPSSATAGTKSRIWCGEHLERVCSPVVLRESQQRWPLCDGGWTVFPPENIHHAEIVPERKRRAKEEHQSVLWERLNLDFIRAALSCQSAAAYWRLEPAGVGKVGEQLPSSAPRRSLNHLLSPRLTLPQEAAPRVSHLRCSTQHTQAQLQRCSCPACVFLWTMTDDVKETRSPIYRFIKPAATCGITLTTTDVIRVVM